MAAALAALPLIVATALASAGQGATAEPEVHPTLAEIFKPPRLLGVRPSRLSISSSGRFALWRWSAEDAEKPKLSWWLAPTDGSAEPRELFPAEPEVDVQWTPRGDELLLRRDGWLELLDVAAATPPRPLFECGEQCSRATFSRSGRHAYFVAGSDQELWALDLEDGSRWSPAATLKNRGRWFDLLEECGSIALFAAPADAPASGSSEKGEERKRVLWLVPLAAGTAPRATTVEEGDEVRVSADGRFASIARTEQEAKRQLIVADFLTEAVTTVPARSNLAGDPAAKASLTLCDLATGERFAPPLDEGERFMLLDVEWSPVGAKLLVHRLSGDYHVRQLLVVDVEGRRARPLFAERDEAWIGGPTLAAEWTRDGSTIVFASEQSGFCHLHAAPAAGGEPRVLTSGDFEVQSLRLLDDGAHALFLANAHDPAERDLFVLELATGARREVPSPRGCVRDFAASRDGARVAYLHEQLAVPAEVWAAAPGGADAPGEAVQLTDTLPEALRSLALPPPKLVELTNPRDGTRLRALLYEPQPFDPTQRHPAVLFVHGAGYLQNVTRSMTEYAVNLLFHQRLARMGFVVLDVDYRHSAGYGRKFRTDVHGHMGGKDLDDLIAGVDYLGTLGCVDPERIGIYGGSYGGFLTLMALFTKPDVFACGAALRSVTDWRTYSAWYTNARLGDPKKDAENYRRSSPIDHAAGLTKPLLLLHGMKDRNVFAQDTIRLIESLIQLGKDFDAMLYPSEDHAFADPESWIDEYRRIERLFLRELRPQRGGLVEPEAVATAEPTRPRPL